MRRLSRFLSVGAAGFLFDFAIFAIALKLVGPFVARGFAFACAVVFTWLMNRTWTFEAKTSPNVSGEFARYLGSSLMSGACNIALYAALILMFGAAAPIPYIAMAAGCGAGLVSNFILYSRFVFAGS